uniref:Androgen-induced gene 1 protein n=1 Tax=Cacopsylla melanoneura TaxID=428564 RepID=A0A8D8ZS03_9HEMI
MINSTLLRVINVGVHVVGAVLFPFGIYTHYKVDIPVDVNPIDSAYGQKFKYLTFIDEIVQASYFTVCVVCDIISLSNVSSVTTLSSVRDYFFASIGFPIGSFVAITFWALFVLDRNLVMPAEFDQYFPMWLNHIVHSMVFVLPVMEIITSPREYPSIQNGLIGLCVFQGVYLVWIHVVYYKCNMWVYPILEKLGLFARYMFLGSSVAFSIALYFGGQFLNNTIWSAQGPSAKKLI